MPHIITMAEDDYDDPDADGLYVHVLQPDGTGLYHPGDLAKDIYSGLYDLPE